MIPNDVPCPACGRKEALHHVEIAPAHEVPRRTRYSCCCGCEWVDPPYLPPLGNSITTAHEFRDPLTVEMLQKELDARDAKLREEFGRSDPR